LGHNFSDLFADRYDKDEVIKLRVQEEKDRELREQRKSELEKKGEGPVHTKARERMEKILLDRGWTVVPGMFMAVVFRLTDMPEKPYTVFKETKYKHSWDIYARKHHDYNLMSELIIEIDGGSHDGRPQQGRDKTAEEYAEFFLGDTRLVRVKIDMLLNLNNSDQYIAGAYKIR